MEYKTDINIQWMKYSINLSKNNTTPHLCVGVVAISKDNKLICSAYNGESGDMLWSQILLKKITRLQQTTVYSLYLTINTISKNTIFDLNTIINILNIDYIYIGLPDPQLNFYADNDPMFRFKNIRRYPDDLQQQIIAINSSHFKKSKQNININPYFYKYRISNMVKNALTAKGLSINKDLFNLNKNTLSLANLISQKYNITTIKATNIINKIVAQAFNSKYANYKSLYDARSISPNWQNNFISLCKSSKIYNKLTTAKILNIGVGDCNEALTLFHNCKHITFVDIANDCLQRLQQQLPNSNTLISKAENLSQISSNTFDIYISLRTYNSAFFSISQAIKEAYRVLKQHGNIIISIANGFLHHKNNYIVSGLLVPNTSFIDIYRGNDTVNKVNNELETTGFSHINTLYSNTEIFISATK